MPTTCPACGNEVPAGMPTCGWCGAALAGGAASGPVGVQRADRRVFGVPPATGLLVVGALLLVLGVVLLFTGSIALGLFALAAGLLVLAAFPSLARRHDESPVARRAVRSFDGLRERADATIESLAARASARRHLARIDAELEQLESARTTGIRELGEATYAQDAAEMERLRGELAAADTALAAKRTEREQLLADTEEKVDEARLRAQPTEQLEPKDEARTEVKPPDDAADADDDSARRAS
jgi:hypothetical protein